MGKKDKLFILQTLYYLGQQFPIRTKIPPSDLFPELYICTMSDSALRNSDTITGFSFSEREALLNSLKNGLVYKMLENAATTTKMIKTSYKSLKKNKKNAIHPYELTSYDLTATEIGWTNGNNFINNKRTAIPAQLIFSDLVHTHHEPVLSQAYLNIVSGGVTRNEALIEAIYSLIQQDAFMTLFLGKVSLPSIQLDTLPSEVRRKVSQCDKIQIIPYFFDLTNDLQVPSFLCIVVSKNSHNPFIGIGVVSNFNIQKAIWRAFEKALYQWSSIRYEALKRKDKVIHINPLFIKTRLDRGFFWADIRAKKYLDFLLNGPTTSLKKYPSPYSSEVVRRKLKDIFSEKKYGVYYWQRKIPYIGYYICKAIIPQLQPTYLCEDCCKEIHNERVTAVSNFFHKHSGTLNTIPYPEFR